MKLFRYQVLAIFCVLLMFGSVDSLAQSSSFLKLQFGDSIFIEVPKNWTFLNEEIRFSHESYY
jgi:hypothetical protein